MKAWYGSYVRLAEDIVVEIEIVGTKRSGFWFDSGGCWPVDIYKMWAPTKLRENKSKQVPKPRSTPIQP